MSSAEPVAGPWPPPRETWPTCSGCGVQLARPDLADGQHADDCTRRRDVTPISKGSTRAPGKRRAHPIQPVSSEPVNTEGSTTDMATPASTKTRGHNLRSTKPKTAKSKTPKKAAAAAPKPSAPAAVVDVLDTRALPFVISWASDDGSFTGKSLTGDWGNARYRIKGYLDRSHTADDVKAGLTAALEAVREGRSFKIHDVQIECTAR